MRAQILGKLSGLSVSIKPDLGRCTFRNEGTGVSHQDFISENEAPVSDLAEPATYPDPITMSEWGSKSTGGFGNSEGAAIFFTSWTRPLDQAKLHHVLQSSLLEELEIARIIYDAVAIHICGSNPNIPFSNQGIILSRTRPGCLMGITLAES